MDSENEPSGFYKCEDLLLFCVLYHSKLKIFGFGLLVGQIICREHVRVEDVTSRNYDGHLFFFIFFYNFLILQICQLI